uniref:Protamine-2 n=2 Tax=Equus TaxID=9789 RepID=F7VJL2_HORSE|nr:protamine-2 isoform X1 [Equus caballus]XP_014705454.2 sperm histone P2b isoform X1 [Equus asinus]ALE18205.1 protamine 2 [Equus asinus]DAA34858.1 TPA_inf: protamine 2 [Equus caballus]
MVRYRVRSPSERPQSGPGQQHGGEDQGQESGHTPENIEAARRTAGSYYRYRRRRCSPRRLYRLRRRRYRSSRRRRRRPCRRRRHRRVCRRVRRRRRCRRRY